MSGKQLPFSFRARPQTPFRYRRYRLSELARMTLFQLRDVCDREKIIHAGLDQMSKEELIQLITRFRGDREPSLIRTHSKMGMERLENTLKTAKHRPLSRKISAPAKIIVYEGLDTTWLDGYQVSSESELEGVNAVIVDRDENICCVLNIETVSGENGLYITRDKRLPCVAANTRDYRLYMFPREISDALFSIYQGADVKLHEITYDVVALMDFRVCIPEKAPMPLVIDFGTTNTAAGIFIDRDYYQKVADGFTLSEVRPDQINYVCFPNSKGEKSPILPTVIGVDWIEGENIRYLVGAEAEQMIGEGYLNAGVSVFYDIKRWVGDYETLEELSDFQGNRIRTPRKEIVRAFLQYIIERAGQQFKCQFTQLYLSFPVKQKARFLALYQELFPDMIIHSEELLDEGVSVLYDVIGRMIDTKRYSEQETYKALIIDCGGGTTDLSSCSFSVRDERVAYNIAIETSYENGDPDFGGNNLTYRVMQLLKIGAAYAITGSGPSVAAVAASMEGDIYRRVDDVGLETVYAPLETAYQAAESVIPTRFKDHAFQNKEEYYMVKNNYYYLFILAERIKKQIFSDSQALQVAVGGEVSHLRESDLLLLETNRWKLAVRRGEKLALEKEFPKVLLSAPMIRLILRADIYDIIHRFLGPLYLDGQLNDFDIIKLTGQSCQIDLFRDSIKEFVPGAVIRQEEAGESYTLKLSCLEGAIRFIRDKRLGYAKVEITSRLPALPYVLVAYTHANQRVELVRCLDRGHLSGAISRQIASTELKLHLLDAKGAERYVYSIHCLPNAFAPCVYTEIEQRYGGKIPQDETDAIENGEVRYFVWAETGEWGFSVVPVSRADDKLFLGSLQLLPFENDQWTQDYFDGLK
jgi:hypothetical protein